MAKPLAGDFACLTCDLVASTEAEDRAGLQRRLERVLQRANAEAPAELVVPLSVTLGDEWQGLLRTPDAAFRLEFRLRRALHPWRMRSGIGVGAVASARRERTAQMDGPCFHRSRAALLVAKKRRGPATVLDSGRPALDAFVNANEALMLGVIDRWTERQFECVMAWLDHGSEPAAARALGIAQPTLHKSVAGALGKEVIAAMEARNNWLAGTGRRP